MPPSISHVYAFVGLEGTTESLGLHGANLWVLQTAPGEQRDRFMGVGAVEAETAARRLLGLDRSGVTSAAEAVPAARRDPWAQKLDADNDDELLMFMSFPSARDPSCATRFPNKSTACIITTAYPETFARFYDAARGDAKGANQSQKRKNAEYDRLKQALQAKLLKGLYKHFPKCEGHVKYIDVATPLTNVYYLGRPDSYGLEHTPSHYAGALTKLRPQTNIPGLLVTGQDVATVGIAGALNGGILTAHACLGYGAWDLIVAKRNLIEDLMALEATQQPGRISALQGAAKKAA